MVRDAIFPVCRVYISTHTNNPNSRRIPIHAVLDSCSSHTVVSKSVARQAGLLPHVSPSSSITLQTIQGYKTTVVSTVTIGISNKADQFSLTLDAYLLPLACTVQTTFSPHGDIVTVPVGVVLGLSNVFGLIEQKDLIKQQEGHLLYRLQTPFGPVFAGTRSTITKSDSTSSSDESDLPTHNFLVQATSTRQLDKQLSRYFSWESIGILPSPADNELYEENLARTIFYKEMKFENGRYSVPLLLRPDCAPLKNNYPQALKQFQSLERRLQRNPDLRTAYVTAMEKNFELGFTRVVPDVDPALEEFQYVIPHSAVLKDSSLTTKTRIVFNASARTHFSPSLNDVILDSPNNLLALPGVITRMRTHKHAFVVDIQKMYQQVHILPQYRKFLRFLWRFENFSGPRRLCEAIAVMFGVKSSSYVCIEAINDLAKMFLDTEFVLGAKALLQERYSDDLSSGADDVDVALRICMDIVHILKTASFALHDFITNSPELFARLPSDMRSSSQSVLLSRPLHDEDEINEHGMTTTVLGLVWHPQDDVFNFVGRLSHDIPPTQQLTRRLVCSLIAVLYDPIGLITAATTTGKIFIRAAWLEKTTWDEPLSPSLQESFRKWYGELPLLKTLSFPRYIFVAPRQECTHVQLLGFSDASAHAIAAVVYLRSVSPSGVVATHLVMAKAKTNPVKNDQTIPRLELCSCVLAARLATTVAEELSIDKKHIYLFSDSLTSLFWLTSSSSLFRTYTRNRVVQATELVPSSQFFFVKGTENPADLSSRGFSPKKLVSTHKNLWLHGPAFIQQTHMALQRPGQPPQEIYDLAMKEKQLHVTVSLLDIDSPYILTLRKYGTLSKFLRITAYILRLVRPAPQAHRSLISPAERQHALEFWARQEQRTAFPEEYSVLTTADRSLEDVQLINDVLKHSSLRSLDPFMDSVGVLRVGGRLVQAPLDDAVKHPILLPAVSGKKTAQLMHSLTAKLIWHYHISQEHAGPSTVLNTLRLAGFWILAARRSVNRILHSCFSCRRYDAQPMQQQMASLPAFRTNPLSAQSSTWTYVNLDAAGPFDLRASAQVTFTKAYALVFVCLVSRATFMHVVSSLSTDDVLLSLRHLIAECGRPAYLYSDQFSSFVRGKKELDCLFKAVDRTQVNKLDILWEFSTPKAPHMNAASEKTIHLLKRALKRVLGQKIVDFFAFSVLVKEIQALINDRPLLPPDSGDIRNDPCITPSLLTRARTLKQLPEISKKDQPDGSNTQKDIREKWLHRQSLSVQLWNVWLKQYLLSLSRFPKWEKANPQPLKTGQIVLCTSEPGKKGEYPLGVVVEVENPEQRSTRRSTYQKSALVRIGNKHIRRSVQSLARLELAD